MAMGNLEGVNSDFIDLEGARRIRFHVLTAGESEGEPVVFIHGNASSATFWQEAMVRLPRRFRSIAPDMRGYGLTEPLPVDATRGVRDWSDDLHALIESMNMRLVHLVGWSMGGGIALQYLLDHPEMVASLTLVSTVSPYGFSGTRGADGEPCFPDYAGSGAGGVNPEFIAQMKAENRESGDSPMLPRNVLNFTYWKPPFRAAREEEFLTSLLQTAIGDRNYPGDWAPSPNWPGFAPGPNGVLNAFSPKYFDVSRIWDIALKPPILWVRGSRDQLVSDTSLWDIAYLGKLGLVPGWPGDDVYPPQPMLAQTRAVLEEYKLKGGCYLEVVFAGCGHSPHVEKVDEFARALTEHISACPRETNQ